MSVHTVIALLTLHIAHILFPLWAVFGGKPFQWFHLAYLLAAGIVLWIITQ